MSYNNAGEVGVASELEGLTTDTDKVTIQPEMAQAELATCPRMGRWCTVVAKLHQVRLEGGGD